MPTYVDLVGAPPAITSPAFAQWDQSLLLARLARCPLSRVGNTEIYFSPTGNDTTGAGTQVSPYQTMTKANTILAATPAGNLTLLFEGGKDFTDANLIINSPNVIVKTYGHGRAYFTKYSSAGSISNAADRGDAYTRTYSFALSGTAVADVRLRRDTTRPWYLAWSPVLVDNIPGSFYHDTGNNIVYFRPHDDSNAKTDGRTYEYVQHNTNSGISVGDVNGTRIHNIAVHGWGAKSDYATATPVYSIKSACSGLSEIVVSDCDLYMSDNHNVGNTSTTGGCMTLLRVRAGGVTTNDSPFIFFASLGGGEYICWDCVCPFQQRPGYDRTPQPAPNGAHSVPIPVTTTAGQSYIQVGGSSAGWPNVSVLPGMQIRLTGGSEETVTVASYTAETGRINLTAPLANSGNTTMVWASGRDAGLTIQYAIGLCLIRNCTNETGDIQVAYSHNSCQNPPVWSDLRDCRSWCINEHFKAREQAPIDRNNMTLALNVVGSNFVQFAWPNSEFPGNASMCVGQWATLSGGDSAPERIRVDYCSGTTVAFTSNIVGADRNAITMDFWGGPAGNYSLPGILSENSGYNVAINCLFEGSFIKRVTPGSPTYYSSGPRGVYINCQIVPKHLHGQGTYAAHFNTASGVPGADFFFCHFHAILRGHHTFGWESLSVISGAAGPHTAKWCTFSYDKDFNTRVRVGMGNTSAKLVGNAYMPMEASSGVDGYDQDASPVLIGNMGAWQAPDRYSPMVSSAERTVFGYPLLWDIASNIRTSTYSTIGPKAVEHRLGAGGIQ